MSLRFGGIQAKTRGAIGEKQSQMQPEVAKGTSYLHSLHSLRADNALAIHLTDVHKAPTWSKAFC